MRRHLVTVTSSYIVASCCYVTRGDKCWSQTLRLKVCVWSQTLRLKVCVWSQTLRLKVCVWSQTLRLKVCVWSQTLHLKVCVWSQTLRLKVCVSSVLMMFSLFREMRDCCANQQCNVSVEKEHGCKYICKLQDCVEQWFSNFLHQVPPQKIFGFPSTTNIKMQYKWLPTAPGVCSLCVCVCVCVFTAVCVCVCVCTLDGLNAEHKFRVCHVTFTFSSTIHSKKKKQTNKRVSFNPYKDIYYCQPLKI